MKYKPSLRSFHLLAACAVMAMTANSAHADLITGVSIQNVSSELGSHNRLADHVVNGNGFEPNGPGTHEIGPNGTMWSSNGTFTTPNDLIGPYPNSYIEFDLEDNYNLDRFMVWNYNESGQTNRGSNLVTISVASAVAGPFTSLGNFNFTVAPNNDTTSFGQLVDLSAFSAANDVRLVRFDVLSNHGAASNWVGLSEVRFFGPEQPPVPPQPLEFTEIVRHTETDEVTLTWKSNPGEKYGLYWTPDLDGIVMHGTHHAIPANVTGTLTTLGPIASPLPNADKLFFLVGPPDLSNPALSQAAGSGNTVTLQFSEPIHPDSVGNSGNFSVTLGGVPVAVLSATLDASGKNIILTLDGSLQAGTEYDVVAQNITTLAGRVIPTAFNGAFQTWDDDPNGVQVFILAGQSNMVGHGKAENGHLEVLGAIGSLRYLAVNDTANYGHLLVDPAAPATSPWKTRENVKVWWRDSDLTAARAVIKGDLKIGYSQSRNPTWYGPEYAFGWQVGDHFTDKPVLIIKVAWGGKSLHVDFRPPSAAARGGVLGPYYTGMIAYVRDCLTNLGTEFPAFNGMGYRIAGIGWHQGWNDRGDPTASAAYEANLVDLISDLRAEFGKPALPFSITTTGMDPPATYTAVELAQLAMVDATKYPAFVGNVKVTDTRPFWRLASVSPSNFGFHWNHNGESQFLNGKAMGDGMVDLLTP